MELQQLIEKWEKEIAKVNITDEDESGKWYENEWSHGRYGAISEFLADIKQLNLPLVINQVCECNNLIYVESKNAHVCHDCLKEYPE